MGYSTSAFHFLGAHIPKDQYTSGHIQSEEEWLGTVIDHLELGPEGVGHISAGDYDRYELFLCVVPDGVDHEVELGTFRVGRLTPDDETTHTWAHYLKMVWDHAGYIGQPDIGWVTVPNCS